MTLQSLGPISASQINTELGFSSTAQLSLGGAASRTLSGIGSGVIGLSNFYGKSNAFQFTKTISVNTQNYNLKSDMIANGYVDGSSFVANITIDSGIYVWSDDINLAGFNTGALSGGTINLTNNGYIIGRGGNAANYNGNFGSGQNGGTALTIQNNISITNNGYIAGGGGGGGGTYYSGQNRWVGGGGGGAGGGSGGQGSGPTLPGGSGGAIGSLGSNGSGTTSGLGPVGGGGAGGGRILPGTGGAGGYVNGGDNNTPPTGGGAGGGGGAMLIWMYQGGILSITGANDGGAGGSGGSAGSSYTYDPNNSNNGVGAGPGGGGWGASGGSAIGSTYFIVVANGAGGYAISLNGFSVTFVKQGTIYGAVS